MFLQLFCLAVGLSGAQGIHADIPSTTQGLEIAIKYWFPDDAEFNESCVSQDCPALNNFSLCSSDINITVLHSVLNTAVGCMRKPICGIVIDNRPTLNVSMTTDEWLRGMEMDGVISTSHGAGYLSNVSNIEFELQLDYNQTHKPPLRITMFISSMRAFGQFNMYLSLRSMMPKFLGQPVSVTLPQVKYDILFNYVTTMSINQSLTDHSYDLKLLHPSLKVHPTFCGLDMPDGFPSITTLFTMMSETLTQNSSLSVRNAAFLEKYFQCVIRTVSKHC